MKKENWGCKMSSNKSEAKLENDATAFKSSCSVKTRDMEKLSLLFRHHRCFRLSSCSVQWLCRPSSHRNHPRLGCRFNQMSWLNQNDRLEFRTLQISVDLNTMIKFNPTLNKVGLEHWVLKYKSFLIARFFVEVEKYLEFRRTILPR